MTKQVQKSIRFPAKAVDVIDKRVKSTLGIGFNEYLKVIVIREAQNFQNDSFITPELQSEIDSAHREVKNGKKTILRNRKDIDNYFNKILNEDE